MEKELFEQRLKKRGDDFWEYGKIYHHTNENLKGYIPNLEDKKVLTVSASGDHLLNCVGMGTTQIDTFDVNKYSPLYQDLKIYAVMFLSPDESLEFIKTLRYDLYLKFRDVLPDNVREFFDFLYHNYSLYQINNILFFECDIHPSEINNYYEIDILNKIKDNLKYLKHNHYETNFFNMTDQITTTYDTIFLSNISHYVNPELFMNYLEYVSEYCLNDNGEIYIAYIYNTHGIKSPIDGLLHVSDKFKINKQTRDFAQKIEVVNFDCAEYSNCKDAVLVLKKQKTRD